MEFIDLFNQKELNSLIRKRANETKIGEEIFLLNNSKNIKEELSQSKVRYVILGIPEDIGVRANFGRGGAHTAWKPVLDSFLNQQSNSFLNAKDICVFGKIKTDDLMEKSAALNPKKSDDLKELRNLVSEVDKRVESVLKLIFECNKTPIIIGGGHNNSYPIIKACSSNLKHKINVINCDPHTDFRNLEGRHSGNGFSYAYEENYIEKYAVFCMHEQYNNIEVVNRFHEQSTRLFYSSYEDIFIREKNNFTESLKRSVNFVSNNATGVEIDIDAITNAPSSAKTSSGLSPVQARQFAYYCGKYLNAQYLHIAEAAPILSHIKADNKTGKLLAYIMSDFIKGNSEQD
jgi:formiminoglutamase